MKYRDLVVVICLVALAAVFWPTAEPTAELVESKPLAVEAKPAIPVANPAASPAASPTPKQLAPDRGHLDGETAPPSRFSRPLKPDLTLQVMKNGDTIEALELKASLKARAETTIPMTSGGKPEFELTFRHEKKAWTFRNHRRAGLSTKSLKKGEAYSWTIRPANLEQPVDKEYLDVLYGKQSLEVSLIVEDGDNEASPFSRKLRSIFFVNLTLPPFEAQP